MVAARSPLKQVRDELAKVQLRLEEVTAKREFDLDVLAALVRILERTGGYMTPEDQAMLRVARARLAEAGR